MNVLLIPDSFKGSMTADQVARIMENCIRDILPHSSCLSVPFSDGGEGALLVLKNHVKGSEKIAAATDALQRPIEAPYFCFEGQKSAWIELSQTAGLLGIGQEERNPLQTTSWGTGKMILHALDEGCNKIYLGIGGSATHDFGTGIISALDGLFLDAKNNKLRQGGGFISDLTRIDLSEVDPRVFQTEWIVACDVQNSLLGSSGAAQTYARQKGASSEMIEKLEKSGAQFAKVVMKQYGIDIKLVKGGGAAGGVAAGLYGLLNAKIEKGFDLLAELTGLHNRIAEADLVITGEGSFDSQSLFGKLPYNVAQLTAKSKTPTLIMAGQSSVDRVHSWPHVEVHQIQPNEMPLEEALQKGEQNLTTKLMAVLANLKSNKRIT